MPPKRKTTATPTPAAPQPPTKRTTRTSGTKASTSSATPSGSTATAQTPKPTKPKAPPKRAGSGPKTKASTKAKKKELTPVELSESEQEEESCPSEEEKPVAKQAKPTAKQTTSTTQMGSTSSKQVKGKASLTSSKKAKASVKTQPPAKSIKPIILSSDDSLSSPVHHQHQPAPPSPPHQPKPRPLPTAMPARKTSTDDEFNTWFAQFAEEDEPDKMGHEGIEALFEQMGLDMNGVLPFVLAWKINAKPGSFGTYYREELRRGMKLERIGTSDKLKTFLLASETELYSKTPADPELANLSFREFYGYVFKFLKDEGQKSLDGQTALVAIGIVLAPRYPLASQFVAYGEELGASFKGVSADVWQQLLAFCDSVDDSLQGYSEYDAWPTVIDSFVEWKKEQKK